METPDKEGLETPRAQTGLMDISMQVLTWCHGWCHGAGYPRLSLSFRDTTRLLNSAKPFVSAEL